MTPNSTTTPARPPHPKRRPGRAQSGARQGPRIPGGALDARIPRLRVRIGSPTSLLAVIPGLLGFDPGHSFVVIGTEPGTAHVRITLRYDLPDPRHPRLAASIADHVVSLLTAQGVTTAVAAGYGTDAAVSPVAAALRERAATAGIAMTELLRADDGRYWSYICRDPECCPPEGTPFDVTDHPAARALRAAGGRVLADRDALSATVAATGGQQGTEMRRATRQCLAQVVRCATRLDRAGMHVAVPRLTATLGQVAVLGAISPTRWVEFADISATHSTERVTSLVQKQLLIVEGSESDQRDGLFRDAHWRSASAAQVRTSTRPIASIPSSQSFSVGMNTFAVGLA